MRREEWEQQEQEEQELELELELDKKQQPEQQGQGQRQRQKFWQNQGETLQRKPTLAQKMTLPRPLPRLQRGTRVSIRLLGLWSKLPVRHQPRPRPQQEQAQARAQMQRRRSLILLELEVLDVDLRLFFILFVYLIVYEIVLQRHTTARGVIGRRGGEGGRGHRRVTSKTRHFDEGRNRICDYTILHTHLSRPPVLSAQHPRARFFIKHLCREKG